MDRTVGIFLTLAVLLLGSVAAMATDPHAQPRCFEVLIAKQYAVVVNHCVEPPELRKLKIRDLP